MLPHTLVLALEILGSHSCAQPSSPQTQPRRLAGRSETPSSISHTMSRDRPRPSTAILLVRVLSWCYGSRLPFSYSSFYFHGPHVPFCPQTLVEGTPVHPLQSSCSQMPQSLSWHLLSQKVLVLFFSYTLEHSVMFQLPWSCHCTPWLHHLYPLNTPHFRPSLMLGGLEIGNLTLVTESSLIS